MWSFFVLKAPFADNEEERLNKLKEYLILDTGSEEFFDEITISAAEICGAKIAAISLIDRERQWFKSSQGLDVRETPRDISFCGHTIMSDEIFIVEDSEKDERFCDNPLFLSEPNVRFYAGAPLITPEGFRIGSLCVIDSEKKILTESQKKILVSFSKLIVKYLELRKNNKKLKVIQKQYDEVQSISQTGYWELDIQTNYIKWSKEVYNIYGLEESTVMTKIDGISYYEKHEQVRLMKMIEHSIKHKQKFSGDFKFIDEKGNRKWVRSAGHTLLGRDENVTHLIGTFQDITSIKNASIKEKTIFEQSLDSIMTLGPPSWKFTSANPAAISLFKTLSEKKFKSIGPWDISPEFQPDGAQSSEKAKNYIDKAMNEGSAFFEWQHMDLEGKKIECTVLLSKIKIENEDFLQATVRDVTNEKEQERDNQYILESMKVGTWKWDITKDHLVWSDSNYKVFNINKNDFTSAYEAWEKAIHPDFKDDVVSELQSALMNSNEYIATFPIILKNKEIAYIGARAEIFRNEKGDAVQIAGINWDKTREYKISQELEKEKKSSYHSSKLASLGELAAGVGHEINNPMAIISGHCSIISRLLKQGKEDQVPKSINIMNSAVCRVTKIVNGLKNFSRADSGENENFNFSDVVLETVEMIRDIYLKESIDITTDLVDDCIVWGNRGRLQQVLVNLMSNARYTLQNRDVKTIEIKVKEIKKKYWVSVTDSGEGIPESIIDKIFDPFYTSKEVNKGTGIGLSLCHRIINEHDGKLTVQTKMGKGSTFKFDLNKDTSHIDVPSTVNVNNRVPSQLSGHVLIVDDEVEVLKLLELFLQEIGLTCDSASNGKEALALYLKNTDRYDFIISDMKMPVMDGATLFKEIRSRKELKQPKLLIITGGVNINFEDQSSEIGKLIDGHFIKPFEMETIKNKLQELSNES